jgi:dTMP kinase
MIAGHPELFVDHYDEDNIGSILRHFFKFVDQKMRRRGKLIVLDGIDASGKGTQSQLLKKALKDRGYDVKYIDFPRYYSSFHGRTVGRYLLGEFGDINSVNPYLASLAYALDRLTARKQIREWLEEGSIVIANRYTSSSMAHQAAKLPPRKRKAFLRWIDEMEYRLHKIPREDLVIFLHMPLEVAQKLLVKKEKRRYAKGKDKDMAEGDLTHQREALKMYSRLLREKRHWVRVNCIDKKGEVLPKEKIHEKILAVLRKRRIISQ